jgi:hypothetical protein
VRFVPEFGMNREYRGSVQKPGKSRHRRTLVIVTFDESEGNNKPERIYTVFLGAMVTNELSPRGENYPPNYADFHGVIPG